MPRKLFELEILGEEIERRYRRARPDVDRLPWGTTRLSEFSEAAVNYGRVYWTSSARQEYLSTPVASATLRALVEAGVPLDLSALFARFPTDELVHAEICARFAMELGGAVPLYYDPDRVVREPSRALSPLMRAAELVIRYYCVSEAFSGPMIRAARKHSSRPLPRALLAAIGRDESVHGTCGCVVLDWAVDSMSRDDRAFLSGVAREALGGIRKMCAAYAHESKLPAEEMHALGILHPEVFIPTARKVAQSHIIEPLRARGFDLPEAGI